MKNKKNIKILVPIVIIIWGVLLYKIYEAFNPEDSTIPQTIATNFTTPKIQKKDTFSLLPVGQDPFLGTMYSKAKSKGSGNGTPKSKEDIAWPTINYFGIVSDKNSKSSVFIIEINGQQHLLKRGDIIEEIELIRGGKGKVKLRYQGKTKEFPIL